MTDIYHPYSINDAAQGAQFAVFFTDTGQMEAGFMSQEEATEHAEDLVSRGLIYLHEAKIVRLTVETREIA